MTPKAISFVTYWGGLMSMSLMTSIGQGYGPTGSSLPIRGWIVALSTYCRDALWVISGHWRFSPLINDKGLQPTFAGLLKACLQAPGLAGLPLSPSTLTLIRLYKDTGP